MPDLDESMNSISAVRREYTGRIEAVANNGDLTPEAKREQTEALTSEREKAVRGAGASYRGAVEEERTALSSKAFGVGLRASVSAGDAAIIRREYRQALADGAATTKPSELEARIKAAKRAGDTNVTRALLQAAYDKGHLDLVDEHGDSAAKELVKMERSHGNHTSARTKGMNIFDRWAGSKDSNRQTTDRFRDALEKR